MTFTHRTVLSTQLNHQILQPTHGQTAAELIDIEAGFLPGLNDFHDFR